MESYGENFFKTLHLQIISELFQNPPDFLTLLIRQSYCIGAGVRTSYLNSVISEKNSVIYWIIFSFTTF